ncbi:MAG: hypothetical protein U0T73_00405 [Chitinophagales bacterium]
MEILKQALEQQLPVMKLMRKYEFGEILIGRKLFGMAKDLLEEVLIEARQQHSDEIALLTARSLHGLSNTQGVPGDYMSLRSAITEDIAALNRISIFFNEFNTAYKNRSGAVSPDGYEKFFNHPYMNLNVDQLSFGERLTLLGAHSLKANIEKSPSALAINERLRHERSQQLVSTLDEINYLNAIVNLGVINGEITQAMEERWLGFLYAFKPTSRWAQSRKFYVEVIIRANRVLQTSRSNCKPLTIYIQDQLADWAALLTEMEQVLIHSKLVELFMRQNRCEEALLSVNFILNSQVAKQQRPVIYRLTSFYELLIHYDLNNWVLLKNLLRNYRSNFLLKSAERFPAEEKVFQILKKSITHSDKKWMNEQRRLLRNEMELNPDLRHEMILRCGWLN